MLHNLSPWQATLTENWLADTTACKTLTVKQSYEFDASGQVYVLSPSIDICMAEQMSGEPNSSSLIQALETVPFKQGFEVYGNLTAYPPKGKTARVIEVMLALYQDQQPLMEKVLRVTGKRQWQRSLLGAKASDPQPLAPVALNYENTYGGIDSEKPDKHFEQNPAGYGYRLKSPIGQHLPLVEYPKQLLTHPKNKGVAASYGPIPQFWQPRLDLMPDVDEQAAVAGEYPYSARLANNFYNCAPQDQQLDVEFSDGFTLKMKGLMPNTDYHDIIAIDLPYIEPVIALFNGEHQKQLAMTCDTLVLDCDANSFHLIWRANILSKLVSAHSQFVVQAPDIVEVRNAS
ncbi:DUF2169 family type VI secretion system accessory protein [Thalassotalea ganghwensis]